MKIYSQALIRSDITFVNPVYAIVHIYEWIYDE